MFWVFNPVFTVDLLPSLEGKTIIVTGANIGLGKASTEALARKGAHVVMACRTLSKAQAALDDIKTRVPDARIDIMELDLSSLASVQRFATDFAARGLPLHSLMNNAGIMALPRHELSKDGVEMQLASNHLGHFYLTLLLLPVIERTAEGGPVTIVNLSSLGHNFAKISGDAGSFFDNDEKGYDPWRAYGRSKLANILFTKELQKRLDSKGQNKIYVNAVHPGGVSTNLAEKSNIPTFLWPLMRFLMTTVDSGCLSQVYAAASPEIVEKGIKAQYFVPTAKVETPSEMARDAALAERLWAWSVATCDAKGFPIPANI